MFFTMNSSQTEENFLQNQVRGNLTVTDGAPVHVLESVSPNRTGEIAWFKDREALNPSEKFVSKNNKLNLINPVKRDLKEVSCIPNTSDINNFTKYPENLVIDPLGKNKRMILWSNKSRAIWPFLGIVGQLVLVALIIVMCDKKKPRNDEDEESLDEMVVPSVSEVVKVSKSVQTPAQERWQMISESIGQPQHGAKAVD